MEKKNKKKKGHHVISLIVFIALIAVTFVVILEEGSIDDLKSVLLNVNPAYIALGLLAMLICVACEGESVRVICNSLGCRMKHGKAFVYACSDYYFSAITPSATGGQPAMVYYMSKDGIPVSTSCIALLLTLIGYMGMLAVMGIIAFVWHFDFVIHSRITLVLMIIGLVMSMFVVLGSMAAMFKNEWVESIGKRAIGLAAKIHLIRNKEARLASFEKHLEEYGAGAEYIKTHPAVTVKSVALCAMQRLMLFMVTYCVYKGMRLSGSSMLDITAMQAILMLTVTTLPLPGAVGISEGMFLVVFDGIFPSELLTSAMILTRGINFYFCITVAGLITMINHIRLLRKDRKCKACTEEGIYL